MTPAEFKEYYQSLLIMQYFNLPKAKATIEAFVGEVVADNVALETRDAFDVDTAIGAQLDILGEYRGISRTVYSFSAGKTFFSMPSYSSPNLPSFKGFALYGASESDVSWYFIRYQDISSSGYSMTDSEFRAVIKFKAKVDSAFLSLSEIDDILLDFFGNFATLTDNGNMTITYNDSPSDPKSNIFNLINQIGILPRPSGVSVSITHV